ncbi:MAG: ABC transporter ATP-binding protein [Bacteroidota bacterium]
MEIKTENILQLDQLSIGYGKNILVENIHYSCGKGKIVALLGINGSGKSTLLKTITGFLSPLKGKVRINGEEVALAGEKKLSHLISIISPQPEIFSAMDVYSLIALGRIPYTGIPGTLHESDHQKITEAIILTGIEPFTHREVHSLSDGERQRVMLARALAQDTPLVIMDEPTAFLDIVQRRRMMQVMKELTRKTGKTFLISTHEAELALEYADETCVIHGNQWLCAADKSIARENFRKAFSLNE